VVSDVPEVPPEGGAVPGTPPRRRLPPPSRRQIWLTAALVAVTAVVGTVIIVTRPGPTPLPAPGSPTDPTSVAAAVPASNPQASADDAELERQLRREIGGCWDQAEPGATDGAYRQDFHYPNGQGCGGRRWDVDVQIFGTTGEATAAAGAAAAGTTLFVSPYSLVIVSAAATPTVTQAVAGQPGIRPVG
jgi:hypothetical protein